MSIIIRLRDYISSDEKAEGVFENPIVKKYLTVQKEWNREFSRELEHYNLDVEIYHIGASLKDLDKKWFGFSKMDSESFEMMGRLK